MERGLKVKNGQYVKKGQIIGYMKMQENKIYFDGTEMFFTVMEKNEVTPYVLNCYNIFLKQSPSKLTSNKLEKFKVLGTLNEEIYHEWSDRVIMTPF